MSKQPRMRKCCGCLQRDLYAARDENEDLRAAIAVLAEEADAAHDKHCSEVSMKRKDQTVCFRRWHDAVAARNANPIASAAIKKAREWKQ